MAKAAKTKSDKDITSTVDQNSPAGLELQVRQPDALTVGNGTVFTRIGFSSITAMSVEAYLEKAKSLRGKAVQVFDISNGMYSMVHGDVALVYDAPVIEQATPADMSKVVSSYSGGVITFSDEYPLLRLGRSSGGRGFVVIKVPSRLRTFSHTSGSKFEYWPPDLIMRIDYDDAGNITDLHVAVMMPGYAHWTRASLKRWPLANVHPDGRVCLGDAKSANRIGTSSTDIQAIAAKGVAMFLESRFNNDLTPPISDQRAKTRDRSSDCVAMASLMTEEGAWRTVSYHSYSGDTSYICGGTDNGTED